MEILENILCGIIFFGGLFAWGVLVNATINAYKTKRKDIKTNEKKDNNK